MTSTTTIQYPYEIREAGEFVRNPCHEREFRLAMALLFDKDYVVSTCCGGFATRIDVAVGAPIGEAWKHPNRSNWLVNQYHPSQAQTMLDNAGFTVGNTPNPNYDPDVPWSQKYVRTYPSDWDGMAGKDLTPLYAAIRSDDNRRKCAGQHLARNLNLSGIPVNSVLKTMKGHYVRVMGAMDYHYYTGGWSGGRFGALAQYSFYHSGKWNPYGPNYITGVNKTGQPNYPDLDPILDDIYYTTGILSSQNASRKAQELYMKYCINIPMYSTKAFWAYKNLLGLVNMDGYSLDNQYTFLNMYTADGSTPTVGLITPPYQLNVLFSSRVYDRQVMDRCYGASAATGINPYNLGRDQPWVIQDWIPKTWVDPEDGNNKTKVTVWFRKDVKWVNPETGSVAGNFTAHDFAFSEWFISAYDWAWTYDSKRLIHHIEILSDYCLEIYMEEKSFWLQYVDDYVVHSETWKNHFCMLNSTTVILDRDYTSYQKLHLRPYITSRPPGEGTGQILEVLDCTLDGTGLLEYEGFQIVMPRDDHTYFQWLQNASAGQQLSITYWTPHAWKSPDGYYPGESQGLDWRDFPGIGQWYLVDYEPAAGGYAAFKANRNYWMETPPLGEVDWMWEWGARDITRLLDGPRTGHYCIDISDVVLTTGAFRTNGSSCPPDPRWFVGADLAPPECYIDISDIVTVTGRFRLKFGGWSNCYPCEPYSQQSRVGICSNHLILSSIVLLTFQICLEYYATISKRFPMKLRVQVGLKYIFYMFFGQLFNVFHVKFHNFPN